MNLNLYKAGNFVVRRGVEGEPKWVCKLTDLGFSRRIAEGGSACDPTFRLGTRDWILPDLVIRIESLTQDGSSIEAAIMKLPFSKRSDVWAMGCVLHFIFTGGQHPYGETINERLENIPKCQPLDQLIERHYFMSFFFFWFNSFWYTFMYSNNNFKVRYLHIRLLLSVEINK